MTTCVSRRMAKETVVVEHLGKEWSRLRLHGNVVVDQVHHVVADPSKRVEHTVHNLVWLQGRDHGVCAGAILVSAKRWDSRAGRVYQHDSKAGRTTHNT